MITDKHGRVWHDGEESGWGPVGNPNEDPDIARERERREGLANDYTEEFRAFQRDNPSQSLDLSNWKQDLVEEYGQPWWDKYGKNSIKAALFVFGEIPAHWDAEEYEEYFRDNISGWDDNPP